jgi:hypothetical protein
VRDEHRRPAELCGRKEGAAQGVGPSAEKTDWSLALDGSESLTLREAPLLEPERPHVGREELQLGLEFLGVITPSIWVGDRNCQVELTVPTASAALDGAVGEVDESCHADEVGVELGYRPERFDPGAEVRMERGCFGGRAPQEVVDGETFELARSDGEQEVMLTHAALPTK